MTKFLNLVIFSILFTVTATAQILSGTVKSEDGKPVSFSTIYVREVAQGTVANEEGYFKIELPAGIYTCVFQCLGYQQVIRQVDLKDDSQPFNIILPYMIYELSEVTISGKEDPAYRIMRMVIAKAPYYAKLVKSFDADVYIKGTLQIKRISPLVKWMAKDDLKELNIKEGDTYLQESVNEIQFTSPDITKQKVVSIKNTFPSFSEDQSNNAIGFLTGNIYGPNGFGAAISPIRPGAFKHYNYQYEGRKDYGSYSVHKITIIPKGKGAQYVAGRIYVVDGLWCLANLDISKEEQMGVKLVLTQNYQEVRENAWIPVTNRMKIDMDLMGNSGTFDYHTTIKYKDLKVNNGSEKEDQKIQKAVHSKEAKFHERKQEQIAAKQKKISELEQKEELNTSEAYKLARMQQKQDEIRIKDSLRHNHDYVQKYQINVDSNAKKMDTAFWNITRPIPLTADEVTSIRVHDSLKLISERKPKNDTLASIKRSGLFSKIIFGGSLKKDSLLSIRSIGLINPFSIYFNVVDGFKYKTDLAIEKKLSNKQYLTLQPMIGYAFAREKLFWEISAKLGPKEEYSYTNNLQFNKIILKAGKQTFDFNPDGIHPLESTIEGLIFKENPARFFLNEYVDLLVQRQFHRTIKGSLNIRINNNESLSNATAFSLFFKETKDYKPNIPENPKYSMDAHQDFSTELSLSYKPMPYYYIKDGIKIPYYGLNDYPEITFSWRRGIPFNHFDTDYNLFKVSVSQQVTLGLKDNLNYMVEGGYFTDTTSMWFPQFQHFAKRPLIAGIKEFFPYFLLLDAYEFSTNEYYIVSHVQYKSPFILLKRLPGFRNRLWNESLFFSYLYSPSNKNYIEPGYGIGNIIYNIGVFAGFSGAEFQQVGLRFAILLFGTKEISL
jgi:hypothetical protein